MWLFSLIGLLLIRSRLLEDLMCMWYCLLVMMILLLMRLLVLLRILIVRLLIGCIVRVMYVRILNNLIALLLRRLRGKVLRIILLLLCLMERMISTIIISIKLEVSSRTDAEIIGFDCIIV